MQVVTKCGFISILGRPNVGKSTILNKILGFKLSGSSKRAQTTRHQILGIKTEADAQMIFVDTPGINLSKNSTALFRTLNETATKAINGVDIVLFICEGLRFQEEDEAVFQAIAKTNSPVFLIINKIDRIKNKDTLFLHLEMLKQKMKFAEIIPISANSGKNLNKLLELIKKHLPIGEFCYPKEQRSLQSHQFYAQEMIREKIMRLLGDELPYSTAVGIENFTVSEKMVTVHAVIWVERDSQKGIVIGKGGEKLKKIGQQARIDMERRFQQKVFLRLWVKIKPNWSDDENALRSFGYLG